MEPETTIDDGTAESQTTTRSEAAAGTDSAMPMTVEEAETVWRGLAPVAQRTFANLGPMQGCWFVGQHGGELAAIVLRPDGQIESYVFVGDPALLRAVPRFTYSAGRHSLLETIRSKSPAGVGCTLVWHQTADELAEVLHVFFLYHATKPLPSERPVETYDASRMTLRTGSAASIMEAALQTALRAAKPSDESAFRDYWARAALAHVVNEGTDLQVLTEAGAKKLDILRACNVHRTRHDLVTQALNGKTNHPKTLSQRLIKGLLIASVAKARLRIGSLVEAVTPALAAGYGSAWPYMQEVEVVALGRPSSELCVRRDVESAAGVFKLLDEGGTVLDPPRVLLRAQEVLLDPGTIYHEWEHVGQHMASTVSILDFTPQELHSEEATECKAIQVVAELLSEFGILY